MDRNKGYYYNDEMEINLTDMTFYFLKKWKVLAALVLAAVILFGGVHIALNPSVLKGTVTEEDIRNYKISSSARAQMDSAYNYRQLYENQMVYMQNSVLMKLDSNSVSNGNLAYYIAAGASTGWLGSSIGNLIYDSELLEQLKEVTGCSDEAYIREIFGCNIVNPTNADGTVASVIESQNIYFWFKCSDDAVCEQMMEAVKGKVPELWSSLTEDNPEFIIQLVDESVTSAIDTDVRTQQTANADLLSGYLTSMTKGEADFEGKELAYYDVVYRGKDAASAGGKVTLKDTVLWMLVGAVLAFLCWAGYYLVRYLMDKHIKYAEEMKRYYGLHLIGRYRPADHPVKGIEKWQEKVVCKSAGSCCAQSYLEETLALLDGDLFLAGSRDEAGTARIMEELSNGEKIVCGNLLQYDSASVKEAKRTGQVILFVKIGNNTHMEIRRELDICRLYCINVVGAVVVE